MAQTIFQGGQAPQLYDQLSSLLDEYLDNKGQNLDETVTKLKELLRPAADVCQDHSNAAVLGVLFFQFLRDLPTEHDDVSKILRLWLETRKFPDYYPPSDPFHIDRPWSRLASMIHAYIYLEVYKAPLSPERQASLREKHEDSPRPWRPSVDSLAIPTLAPMEWARVNEFVARVHITVPSMSHLCNRGLYTLLDALEEECSPEILDNILPAAAVWILMAGGPLRTTDAEKYAGIDYRGYQDFGSKRLPWSHGSLYAGSTGLCDERWRFWRGRFSVLKDDERLGGVTKDYARRAWREMVKLDDVSSSRSLMSTKDANIPMRPRGKT